MTTARHLHTDRHSADASTSYWFTLDGEGYGIAETDDGEQNALDFEGYPLDQGPERDRVLEECIVTDTMRRDR